MLHSWRTVSRHGEVPALGEQIAHMSKFVAGANQIGYASIGLDAATGLTKIHNACTEGSQCQKTTAREIGRFSGAVGGAHGGGSIAIGAASSIAIAFGVVLSAPVITVVGISDAVVGSYYDGNKFSNMGDQVGEVISDAATKDQKKLWTCFIK